MQLLNPSSLSSLVFFSKYCFTLLMWPSLPAARSQSYGGREQGDSSPFITAAAATGSPIITPGGTYPQQVYHMPPPQVAYVQSPAGMVPQQVVQQVCQMFCYKNKTCFCKTVIIAKDVVISVFTIQPHHPRKQRKHHNPHQSHWCRWNPLLQPLEPIESFKDPKTYLLRKACTSCFQTFPLSLQTITCFAITIERDQLSVYSS